MRSLFSFISVGLLWAVLWAGLALAAGALIAFVDPSEIEVGEEPLVLAPVVGLAGFVCGVIFRAVRLAATRTHIGEDSLLNIAATGAAVSAAVPLVAGKGLPELLVIVPVGVICALATNIVARRGLLSGSSA